MKEYFIEIGSLIIAVATIVVTVYLSYREVRNSNQQLLEQFKRSFFAEYTKRYQEIVLAMPSEVFLGTAMINGETKKYMQLYFDLCSEEYHLHQDGIIPDDVWNYWRDGMRIVMKIEMYKLCWNALKGMYNKDFYRFFENEVLRFGTND